MHELQTTPNGEACFITLTFDNDNLPPDRSLDVQHWQTFAKALRYEMAMCKTHQETTCKICPPRQTLRFMHCGEYGSKDKSFRPHYHAALYGIDFNQVDAIYMGDSKKGDKLYESPSLTKLWGKGRCVLGTLTFKSAGYITRYLSKGAVTGKKAQAYYERIGLEHEGEVTNLKRPYVTMSRKPGIGYEWIKKYHSEVYPWDEVITNGHPAQPPKYYDTFYAKLNPEGMKAIKLKRIAKGNLDKEHQTPERMAVRERVLKARMGNIEHQEI